MHARSREGKRSKCVSQVRIDHIASTLAPDVEAETAVVDSKRSRRKRSATQNSVLTSTVNQGGQGACLFSPFFDDQLYVVDSAAGTTGRCDNILVVSANSIASLPDDTYDTAKAVPVAASDIGVRHLFSAQLTEADDALSPVGPLLSVLPTGAPCYVAAGTHTLFTSDVDLSNSSLNLAGPAPSKGSAKAPTRTQCTSSPLLRPKHRPGRRASAPAPHQQGGALEGKHKWGDSCAGTMVFNSSAGVLVRLVATSVTSWPTTLEVWDVWDGKMLFSMSQLQLSTAMSCCSFLQSPGLMVQVLHSKFTRCELSPDSKHLLVLVHATVLPGACEQCSAFIMDVKKASTDAASEDLSNCLRWLQILCARTAPTTNVRHLAAAFHPYYTTEDNFKLLDLFSNSIAVLTHLQQQGDILQTQLWRRLLVFNVKTNEKLWENSCRCSQIDMRFLDLKFSADGHYLALSLGSSSIELFSARNGSPLRVLEADQRYGVGVHLHSIAISPTARWIAAMSGKAEMCVWVGHVTRLGHLCVVVLKQQCLKCKVTDVNSTLLRVLPRSAHHQLVGVHTLNH